MAAATARKSSTATAVPKAGSNAITDWRSSRVCESVTAFRRAVYELTSAIPRGKVTTYGAIARALDGTSSQAVGTALHHNPFAPEVPCHRVCKTAGKGRVCLGGFSGTGPADTESPDIARKRSMLAAEGVLFTHDLFIKDPGLVVDVEHFPADALARARAWLDSSPAASAASAPAARPGKRGRAGDDPAAGMGAGGDADEEDAAANGLSTNGRQKPRAARKPEELSVLVSKTTYKGSAATASVPLDIRASLSAPGTTAEAVRLACRSGALAGHTSGLAPGYAQANLVFVPKEYAFDFLLFCVRNPKPCPLLEVCEVGVWEPKTMAKGGDLRTDLPKYNVYRNGVLSETVTDIRHLWPDAPAAPGAAPDARNDWVSFLLGCSFSFEEALLRDGVPVRHLQQEKTGELATNGNGKKAALAKDARNVPMYKTCIPTASSGPFRGPLVVSMRPMTPAQAAEADSITSRFPRVHGRPVFWGDSAKLGITDISRPDYGDAVTVLRGEVPVFWACGVTPQAALVEAKLPIAITHAPGHMLVCDAMNESLAGLPEIQVP